MSSQVTIVNLREALDQKNCDHGMDRSAHTSSTSASNVSFSKKVVTTKPTLSRSDYSESERRATWYDRPELRSMKAQEKNLVKLMEQGEPIIDGDCTRGLETKTREGSKRRQLVILDAVTAVLDEQEDQEIRCSLDPEVLADVYRRHTRRSQEQALERAKADQLSV